MRRRTLLKAIASAPLSARLPLAALLTRSSMARAAGESPIRFLSLFHPDGCSPVDWHPSAGSNPSLKQMTAPLQKVKQHCVFLDGVTLVGQGETHEGGAAKLLTGNSANGQSGASSSIEVLMGAQNDTLFRSLQMGCLGGYWPDKSISFSGTTRLPYEDNPRSAYRTLFGGAGGGGGVTASADDQLNILSAAAADLSRLRTQLGSVERERLDMHADSLSQLEKRVKALKNNSGPAEGDIDFQGLGTDDSRNTSALKKLSAVQQDIVIQALSSDLTRAVSFMFSHPVSPIVVPGGSGGDHDLSHAGGAGYINSKRWWISEIADFIEKLANTPDGNGSLLDNTIVMLCSEIGHGGLHSHTRIPFVLAGGANTGLTGNRAISFKGASHADLLTLIAQKAGYNLGNIGLASGPLAGIW